MSMAVEYRPPVGGLGYEQSRYAHPQFSNPWHTSAVTSSPSNPLYPAHYNDSPTTLEHPSMAKTQPQVSMGYAGNPAASTLGSDLVPTRSYGSSYTTSATSNPSYTATTAGARYSPEQIPTSHPYAYSSNLERRDSYPYVLPDLSSDWCTDIPTSGSNSSQASYSDEMAASRGMVAMANGTDMTPRGHMYGARAGSSDSYGFPAPAHSHHSSISSGSANGAYPYYAASSSSYQNSVDGSSVTDYSSASEDVPRPLPPPTQMISGFPPEPQAMMNQFNAKVSPSAQKKHKCRICEKRFTRPSSLQTHMYSHTGEKRKFE
ncbi:MAG: hypothetical protein Q9159_000018 [Coniocarpon cinnabarinum]